jgi:hypothetical protein
MSATQQERDAARVLANALDALEDALIMADSELDNLRELMPVGTVADADWSLLTVALHDAALICDAIDGGQAVRPDASFIVRRIGIIAAYDYCREMQRRAE